MSDTNNNPESLVTQAELSRLLKVPAMTIHRAMAGGLFRPDFLAGNHYQLFRRSSIAVIAAKLKTSAR